MIFWAYFNVFLQRNAMLARYYAVVIIDVKKRFFTFFIRITFFYVFNVFLTLQCVCILRSCIGFTPASPSSL